MVGRWKFCIHALVSWRWRPRHRAWHEWRIPIHCAHAFGRDKRDPPARRSTARRTPLATACAAHCVRGICRHYPPPTTRTQKTGNRRIKNNVPPLLISTPGCCTIRAIFEQRRGFGHGVRGHSFLFSLFRKQLPPIDLFLGKHCPWRANARRLGRNPQPPCAFH